MSQSQGSTFMCPMGVVTFGGRQSKIIEPFYRFYVPWVCSFDNYLGYTINPFMPIGAFNICYPLTASLGIMGEPRVPPLSIMLALFVNFVNSNH